ncbi:MAG: MOSC domain-containing protein [Gammaproteobacteria bacterium]|nr:MOSC domain-containing protein [Gammaproteobacteria bacterium]
MSTVSRNFVYPIKSCRGIEVESAELTPRGLAHDRRYMLIDANGRFLTQRRHPQMGRIEVAFDDGAYRVTAPGREALSLPFALDSAVDTVCRVKVWNDTVEATLAPPEINIWFSEFLGFACGLVYLADDQHRAVTNEAAEFDDEVSFADGAPVLLISDASLAELNRRLTQPVTMRRFRPNLVVTADKPHAEDGWQRVKIGDAELDVGWPCARCVLTTIDPETGERDPGNEPMTTLTGYRRHNGGVHFGQNLLPRTLGRIDVGADCEINEILAS